MSHVMGMAIESLVAVLLLLTIAYCIVLNKRLQRLKADEHSLKATIGELITATEIAERAIGGLKQTVRDVNENLGNQLSAATQMSAHLKHQLAEGDGGHVEQQRADADGIARGAHIGEVDHRAHDQPVEQRGHAGGDEALAAQLAGCQRGQQRGQGTQHDVKPDRAGHPVCQQAADGQPGNGVHGQNRQQRQRLGDSELDRFEADRLEDQGQNHVNGGDQPGANDGAGGEAGSGVGGVHGGIPLVF